MKIKLCSPLACAVGLFVLATSAQADTVNAWSQMGFTVELSSGVLNVAPAGFVNTADATHNNPSIPVSASDSMATVDGNAFATAGTSLATSLGLNAGNYFLIDAFASLDAVAGANSSASATSLAFFDLSFSDVVGSWVTLTVTPLFYQNSLPLAGTAPSLSSGYVSAFLSLGDASFLSFANYGDLSGYADFAPFSITVGANETVQLNAAATAGLSVPDRSASLALLAIGLASLAVLQRKFVPALTAR